MLCYSVIDVHLPIKVNVLIEATPQLHCVLSPVTHIIRLVALVQLRAMFAAEEGAIYILKRDIYSLSSTTLPLSYQRRYWLLFSLPSSPSSLPCSSHTLFLPSTSYFLSVLFVWRLDLYGTQEGYQIVNFW